MRFQPKTYKFPAAVLTAGIVALALGTGYAEEAHPPEGQIMATLRSCQQTSPSCAATTADAAGILVFPSVVKADFIIGGAGGKGALIEHGRITGYYSIGAATAGLQAGIDQASQVYVFRTARALANLKNAPNGDWKLGTNVGITLVSANANNATATGETLAYVFDASGLHAGIALDAFDVWKTGQARPSYTVTPPASPGKMPY